RIHQFGRDEIEAFRRLPVALPDLRTEFAGPFADRIGLQERVFAVARLFPDLKLGLFLEDAQQDGRVEVHPLLRNERHGGRRHWLKMLRAHGRAGDAAALADAAGQKERAGSDNSRATDRTDEPTAQRKTPKTALLG